MPSMARKERRLSRANSGNTQVPRTSFLLTQNRWMGTTPSAASAVKVGKDAGATTLTPASFIADAERYLRFVASGCCPVDARGPGFTSGTFNSRALQIPGLDNVFEHDEPACVSEPNGKKKECICNQIPRRRPECYKAAGTTSCHVQVQSLSQNGDGKMHAGMEGSMRSRTWG